MKNTLLIFSLMIALGSCKDKSKDMTSRRWTQITSITPWSSGSGSTSSLVSPVVFGGKIFVIGKNKVWSHMENGRKWEVAHDSAPWKDETIRSPSYRGGSVPNATAFVFQNKLWVVVQNKNSTRSSSPLYTSALELAVKAWSSKDGKAWANTTFTSLAISGSNAPYYTFSVLNGTLWALSSSKIQSSTDGTAWTAESTSPSWSSIDVVLAFQGKLWIGGRKTVGAEAKVWSSPDGKTWTDIPGASLPSDAFEFEGRMFSASSRLMSSSDAKQWRDEGFAPYDGQPLVLGGSIWKIVNSSVWVY